MICCHALGAATFPSLKEPLCNVRFGSLADISQCNRHVRFYPRKRTLLRREWDVLLSAKADIRSQSMPHYNVYVQLTFRAQARSY